MKNEAHVILRMLESVNPIIDGCVCIDTGSTDNSKDIVKKFFEDNNKPCEIYDHPFVDFEDARNYALEKVKGKSDYSFWIDCDEILKIDDKFKLKDFKDKLSKHDSALCPVIYNSTNYARRSFLKTDKSFYWVGKVHELLYCKENETVFTIEGLTTFVYSDGSSWANQKEKYLGHAAILEKEVAKNNDPRDVFYLAQSYYDAGENEKSLEWYRKRVSMESGFFEERYYSQLKAGIILANLKSDSDKVICEWLRCSILDNTRAEHLAYIIKELQLQNQWEASYIFSKYAVDRFHGKNPYPNRHLFLNSSVYSHGLFDLHKINCVVSNRLKELNLEIDVCIISNAKNAELKKVTEAGIKTLLASETDIKFNVFVVESCNWVRYTTPNTTTLYTNEPFGYHRYLNLARKKGTAPYIFLANNDLIYDKGWASNMIRAMIYSEIHHGELLSTSPICPQIDHGIDKKYNIHFGHTVRKELAGWAIFQQRKIYDIIGDLDESVDFWYSDNIYSLQLIHYKLRHALVVNSSVNHHDKNLGITGESTLDDNKKIEYTNGQYEKYLIAKIKYL